MRTSRPKLPGGAERRGALLAWLLLGLVACSGETVAGTGSPRVPGAVLEPTLLDDREEMDAYLAAFPTEAYEIVEVAGVGRFYLDRDLRAPRPLQQFAAVKWQLKSGRPWEPEVAAAMARHVAPGSTALDLGAHIGSHTVTLARLVGPGGIVYAFEPQKKIYRELVKNLELNGIENAVPLRFAVGAEHAVIEMDPTRALDGRTRVGAGGDRAELRTLDGFGFRDVSLVKIDVEGFELLVLEGAAETIRAWHPAIVIEITGAGRYDALPPEQKAHVDAVRAFLEERDYALEFVTYSGEPHYLALHRPGS